MNDRLATLITLGVIAFVSAVMAIAILSEKQTIEKMRICVENGGSWSSTWGGTCTVGAKP